MSLSTRLHQQEACPADLGKAMKPPAVYETEGVAQVVRSAQGELTAVAMPIATTLIREPAGYGMPSSKRLLSSIRHLNVPTWSLLLAVLVLQTALSIRLLRANTAFGDEALYLWAGHLEWAHWLHGESSTAQAEFPTWFSGSPVIYPPLGAIADSWGGLAGARLLSLGFMVGATTCLYGTTARLLDRRAAAFAALIFVVLAPTEDLGAFATYDAMALFLLVFATWMGVVAAGGRLCRLAILLPMSGAVIVLADATKYATTLWNPVAIVVIATAVWRSRGFRSGVLAGTVVSVSSAICLKAALTAGGYSYWQGILLTTLARSSSDAPTAAVLHQSFTLVGPVLVLALFGLFASVGDDWRTRVLCGTATIAVLLAPLNQARIHTTVSLHKHVDFGAWFAAIAAGYVISRISRMDSRRGWGAIISIAIAIPVLIGSLGQATQWAVYWPNTNGMIAAMQPIVRPNGGKYLFEEFDVAYYYLHDQVYPGQLTSMFGFLYWDPVLHKELGGNFAFEQAIAQHYFEVVEVDGQNIQKSTTKAIEHELARTSAYRLVYKQQWGPSRVVGPEHGWIEIWRLATPQGSRS
jgi:hypothetical protein